MVRHTLAVLMVVALGLGVMGCNKAELEAKDKEITGLKAKVTALETENADLKANVATLEEQAAAAKSANKTSVISKQRKSAKQRR